MAKIWCNICNKPQAQAKSTTIWATNPFNGMLLVCYACRLKMGLAKPRLPIPSTKPPKPPYTSSGPLVGFGGTSYKLKYKLPNKRKSKR